MWTLMSSLTQSSTYLRFLRALIFKYLGRSKLWNAFHSIRLIVSRNIHTLTSKQTALQVPGLKKPDKSTVNKLHMLSTKWNASCHQNSRLNLKIGIRAGIALLCTSNEDGWTWVDLGLLKDRERTGPTSSLSAHASADARPVGLHASRHCVLPGVSDNALAVEHLHMPQS